MIVQYNSQNRLKAGFNQPVRINASVGINNKRHSALEREKAKVSALINYTNSPDLMMDLSIYQTKDELWQFMLDAFDGPVGLIPHYAIFDYNYGIDVHQLIDRIRFVVESGISFITVHASPNTELAVMANKTSKIPVTSRGGSLVIRDMLINKREQSIYADAFEDICKIAKSKNVVINLGTTFRSASVVEGLDLVCKTEICKQKYFIDKATKIGVQVVLEGPGHIPISLIDQYIAMTEQFNVPLMPLGPIITDNYPGLDHYSSSIGAAYMMSKTRGGIINAVTRIEHTGGLPSIRYMTEALDAARVAAHAASITYCKCTFEKEMAIFKARASKQSCSHSNYTTKGCSRCRELCPLIY